MYSKMKNKCVFHKIINVFSKKLLIPRMPNYYSGRISEEWGGMQSSHREPIAKYILLGTIRAGARNISCVGEMLFCRPLLRKGRQISLKLLKKRKKTAKCRP